SVAHFSFHHWTHEAMGAVFERQVFVCPKAKPVAFAHCRPERGRSPPAAVLTCDQRLAFPWTLAPHMCAADRDGPRSVVARMRPHNLYEEQKRRKAPPKSSFTSRSISAVVGSQPVAARSAYLSTNTPERTSRK